ncbi:MAG TPA: RNA polymerase sigma factor [Candidatus Magasanikbacteria bacterium]|nr:RNA polymerase sigma factor [Candidatus Magasanikbacteria bacterium]
MDPLRTDEELALDVQQGNSEAFSMLFNRYEQKMLRYGKRFLYTYEDLEDAVQEVFIKAYKNVQSFNTTKKFSTWLYRIAHNTFINVIKKNGREPVSFFDFDTLVKIPSKTTDTLEDDFLKAQDSESLAGIMKKLSPKYREALVLFYFEELEYKEIAEVLKIPTSTVGVRITRGRAMLKKMISNT